jgi:hypothetical protein
MQFTFISYKKKSLEAWNHFFSCLLSQLFWPMGWLAITEFNLLFLHKRYRYSWILDFFGSRLTEQLELTLDSFFSGGPNPWYIFPNCSRIRKKGNRKGWYIDLLCSHNLNRKLAYIDFISWGCSSDIQKRPPSCIELWQILIINPNTRAPANDEWNPLLNTCFQADADFWKQTVHICFEKPLCSACFSRTMHLIYTPYGELGRFTFRPHFVPGSHWILWYRCIAI